MLHGSDKFIACKNRSRKIYRRRYRLCSIITMCFIENMKGERFMANILQRDGLTVELLEKLSYKSELGINLKKNLHYFDKESLLNELVKINEWYDEFQELYELALDYRIKSIQSAMLKYERYYPEHQARKVFDDLLGFRSLCDNSVGVQLRKLYESAKIQTEQDFKEELKHVLSGC